MVKRVGSAALWFLAVGWGLNYVVAITDVSPVIAVTVAAAVSAFVGVDPLQFFWPARDVSPVFPARETVPAAGAISNQV